MAAFEYYRVQGWITAYCAHAHSVTHTTVLQAFNTCHTCIYESIMVIIYLPLFSKRAERQAYVCKTTNLLSGPSLCGVGNSMLGTEEKDFSFLPCNVADWASHCSCLIASPDRMICHQYVVRVSSVQQPLLPKVWVSAYFASPRDQAENDSGSWDTCLLRRKMISDLYYTTGLEEK
jgi:hypothetical protein